MRAIILSVIYSVIIPSGEAILAAKNGKPGAVTISAGVVQIKRSGSLFLFKMTG